MGITDKVLIGEGGDLDACVVVGADSEVPLVVELLGRGNGVCVLVGPLGREVGLEFCVPDGLVVPEALGKTPDTVDPERGTVSVTDPEVITVWDGELPAPVDTGIGIVKVVNPDVMTVSEGVVSLALGGIVNVTDSEVTTVPVSVTLFGGEVDGDEPKSDVVSVTVGVSGGGAEVVVLVGALGGVTDEGKVSVGVFGREPSVCVGDGVLGGEPSV